MKCADCGGEYISKSGAFLTSDPVVGDFTVDLDEYLKCSGCGEVLLDHQSCKQLEARCGELMREIIMSQPLGDFITASDTAKMLDMTPQALKGHRRIRRGFIIQTEFCGKTVYLRESVERFKKTGDGRFFLLGWRGCVPSFSAGSAA